jgi:thiamine transport system permease protein
MRELVSDPWVGDVVLFTLQQALLSALLAVLCGLPIAWLVSHTHSRWEALWQGPLLLPFVLPPVVLVLLVVMAFGQNGWITQTVYRWSGWDFNIYGWTGILLAHVLYNVPLTMMLVGGRWRFVSQRYDAVAQTLGRPAGWRFWRVTLPLLQPSIAAAGIFTFLLCLNSFVVILVLGGGTSLPTLEVLIYQFARVDLDLQAAAWLALLQTGLALLGSALGLRLQAGEHRGEKVRASRAVLPRRGWSLLVCGGWTGVWLSVTLLLLLLLLLDSLAGASGAGAEESLGKHYSYWLFDEKAQFWPSLWNSVRISLCSATFSTALGLGLSHYLARKRASWFGQLLVLLPATVSVVVLGTAWFHVRQTALATGWGAIPFAAQVILLHTLLTAPLSLWTLRPMLLATPQIWEQTEQVLDAQNRKRLQLWGRWWRPALSLQFTLAFVLSFGELNIALLFSDGTEQTVPLLLYQSLGSYRVGQASALATLLLCLLWGTWGLTPWLWRSLRMAQGLSRD